MKSAGGGLYIARCSVESQSKSCIASASAGGLSDAETNSVRFARLSPGKCRKSARWLLCQSRLSTIPARSLWPTQSGVLRESVEIAAGRAPSAWRSASKVGRLVEVPTKGAGGCQTLRWVSSISGSSPSCSQKNLLQILPNFRFTRHH